MCYNNNNSFILKMRVFIAFTACCCIWSTQVHGLGGNSVFIFSEVFGQLVTSSTLRWVSETNGKRPEDPVVATEEILPGEEEEKNSATGDIDEAKLDAVIKRRIYVCRALKNGIWIPGQLEYQQSACLVASFGEVSSFTKYEVLESISDSARLSWVKFSKFDQLPVGAVYGGENAFVARRKIDSKDGNEPILGRKHLVGKIRKQGFSRIITVISEDGREEEFSEGEILVETEPIRYELAVQSFNTIRKKLSKTRQALGYTILENSESSPMHVDAVVAYDEQYSMSWGQGKAILKGLNTTIRLPKGEILEQIQWGIPDNEERNNVYKVEAFLEPGTAVNVSLAGNQTVTEIPYNGKLVAIYKDDSTKARSITGIQREEAMKDLLATYSPAYFLSNFSLVPTTTTSTTTTTTTTTTTSTTTTTTTTTTTPPPPTTKKTEKTDRKDENMINDQASRNHAAKQEMTSEKQSHGIAAKTLPATLTVVTAIITSFICRIT